MPSSLAPEYENRKAWANITHCHHNPQGVARYDGGSNHRKSNVDPNWQRRRSNHDRMWEGLEPRHLTPNHQATTNNHPLNCRLIPYLLLNSWGWVYDWRGWRHDLHSRPLDPLYSFNMMMKRYVPRMTHASSWTWSHNRSECYRWFIITPAYKKDRRDPDLCHARSKHRYRTKYPRAAMKNASSFLPFPSHACSSVPSSCQLHFGFYQNNIVFRIYVSF